MVHVQVAEQTPYWEFALLTDTLEDAPIPF
jgi:hypothetical protein